MDNLNLYLEGIVFYKIPICICLVSIFYLLFLQIYIFEDKNNALNKKYLLKLVNLNMCLIIVFIIMFIYILLSINNSDIFSESNNSLLLSTYILPFIIIYLIILQYTTFFSKKKQKNKKLINGIIIFIIILFLLFCILSGYIDAWIVDSLQTLFRISDRQIKSDNSSFNNNKNDKIKIFTPKENSEGSSSSMGQSIDEVPHVLPYVIYKVLPKTVQQYFERNHINPSIEKGAKDLLNKPESETGKVLKQDMLRRVKAYIGEHNDDFEIARSTNDLGIIDPNNQGNSVPYFTASKEGKIYECVNTDAMLKDYARRISESKAPAQTTLEKSMIKSFTHYISQGKTLCTTKK